jgi:CheY-like chemotaxis protein
MTGYEACAVIKADERLKDIPVIFVTAVEDARLNRFAFQAGAAACLTKPFRHEALVATIEAVLANAKRGRGPKAKNRGGGH